MEFHQKIIKNPYLWHWLLLSRSFTMISYFLSQKTKDPDYFQAFSFNFWDSVGYGKRYKYVEMKWKHRLKRECFTDHALTSIPSLIQLRLRLFLGHWLQWKIMCLATLAKLDLYDQRNVFHNCIEKTHGNEGLYLRRL